MKWLAAILLFASAPALAADEALAKRLYREASADYAARDYGAALDLFRQAAAASPRPALLFNIAQCERQLGRYADAERDYRAFLVEARPSAAVRARVDGLIAQMPPAPPPEAPPAAAAPAPAAPLPAPMAPAASSPAQPALALAPPAPLPVIPRPWYRSVVGWVLAAAGAGVIATGGGLLAQGNEFDDQIAQVSSLARAKELQANRDTYRRAGAALLAVGGAAMVSGAVVFAIAGKRHKAAHAYLAPTVSGVLIGGAF